MSSVRKNRIPSGEILARFGLVLFGVVLALAAVEGGMRAAGSLIRLAQERRNQSTLRRKHELRILCLGESTTAGTGRYGRYPEVLEDLLNAQTLPGRVAVVNKGRSGADSEEIVTKLESDLDELTPDLVVVMMGINDAGKTHSYRTILGPGAKHGYGSLRLYKLYRVLRSTVGQAGSPVADEDPLVIGEGVAWARTSADVEEINSEGNRPVSGDPYATGEVPLEVRERIDRQEDEIAERLLIDLLQANADLPAAHVELADLYTRIGQLDGAHRALLRGVAAVPESIALQAGLANSYAAQENLERAIERMRFVVESLLAPDDVGGQTHYRTALADFYERSGQYERAERELIGVVERLNPGDDVIYEKLIDFYEHRGQRELAAERREVQRRIRYEYLNPTTRERYEALRNELQARGIPLVAVQYPARRVEALERMLGDDPGVIYVDNGSFRQLAEADGYEKYFYDRFAGDFGHLTELGNELLATNVARAIVEEFFGLGFEAGRTPERAETVILAPTG